ncbi:conserved hypothetical protein [Pediculus humanus corporis]|uniref:Ska2 N-terminal domain-containing protein n=1 Tax=Pediculus humanus subsp. corporis TaxID=121224 RepID=E0VK23_PEDHC|nr:uncharacterized protein Phum_PHUM254990 [Pediculus humanus corporis]EEB13729.1 conserved hypothetical protein [Pediculus humanus corporis]
MENKVSYLEETVANTDKKLENLSWKVEKWERAVSEASLVDESTQFEESEQENYVLNLLQDVTQVKDDYEQLRSDITEIQQLQKELTDCLRVQLQNMHTKYGFLRSKLGPALPSCLMMSTNSYQSSPTKQPGTSHRSNSK